MCNNLLAFNFFFFTACLAPNIHFTPQTNPQLTSAETKLCWALREACIEPEAEFISILEVRQLGPNISKVLKKMFILIDSFHLALQLLSDEASSFSWDKIDKTSIIKFSRDQKEMLFWLQKQPGISENCRWVSILFSLKNTLEGSFGLLVHSRLTLNGELLFPALFNILIDKAWTDYALAKDRFDWHTFLLERFKMTFPHKIKNAESFNCGIIQALNKIQGFVEVAKKNNGQFIQEVPSSPSFARSLLRSPKGPPTAHNFQESFVSSS